MPAFRQDMRKLTLRPIEEKELGEIASRQAENPKELAELFDNKPIWSSLTSAQVREKITEEQKKPNTAVFSIYSGDTFIGVGYWSANWDTWSPWSWFIIWPGHRRKGYGTQAVKLFMDKCFLENPGHVATASAMDWNSPAISFLKNYGFREIGRMRRVVVDEGKYRDLLFFDMLKSEYLARGKGVRR